MEKLIPILEAEYHYNAVLAQDFEEETPSVAKTMTSLSEFGISAPIPDFNVALKADALKDRDFFKRYLDRFKTEANQQKVLDNLFEELRFGHHTVSEHIKSLKQKSEVYVALFSPYIQETLTKPALDIICLIRNNISDFERLFIKYNPLVFLSDSEKSAYNFLEANKYIAEVQEQLSALNQFYVAIGDNEGLEDIKSRRLMLSNDDYRIDIANSIFNGDSSDMFILQVHREIFYFLYNLVEQAKEFKKTREALDLTKRDKKENSESQLVTKTQIKPEPQAVVPALQTVVQADKAILKPADVTLSAVEAKQTAETVLKPQVVSHPSKKIAPGVSVILEKDLSTGMTSQTLAKEAEVLASHFYPKSLDSSVRSTAASSSILDTHSSALTPVSVPTTPASSLTFSKAVARKVPLPPVQEEKSLNEIPRHILKQLGQKKHKAVLTDLFYGNLRQVNIKESSLQDILKVIHGEFDERREAVRRRLSFRGQVGFVPNSSSPEFIAHYHTTNTRHASSSVLAHYRDFFHRIGVTPHQFWPKEYQATDYRATKTTRVYCKLSGAD